MDVSLWDYRVLDRFLGVVEFTTGQTPLYLLVLYKFSCPLVCLFVCLNVHFSRYSGLKFANIVSLWNLQNYSTPRSSSSWTLSFLPSFLSSVWACVFTYSSTVNLLGNAYTCTLELPGVICTAWIAQTSRHCFGFVQIWVFLCSHE